MKLFPPSIIVALGIFAAQNSRSAVAADQVATNVPVPPQSAVPNAPTVLPGQGLAQHDFFYAGEAKDERMFIVWHGAIVWSYTHPAKGEISDATLLPDGKILFAHQHGVTEITAGKKVVWNFDAPTNTEIHTCLLYTSHTKRADAPVRRDQIFPARARRVGQRLAAQNPAMQ